MKRIIVISDLHLGLDDKVSELVENRSLLIEFLKKIRRDKDIDEIVIAGDFLDQWFYPADYELNENSDEFYIEVAKNNKKLIDEIQGTIEDNIRVVYVPGNHDMTLSKETLDNILPGIIQARDARGLGRYITGERKEIVIEHGHRYEIFCAPDSISNSEFMEYGKPIIPPGYFYGRLGLTSYLQGMPKIKKDIKEIKEPKKENENQYVAYQYYKFWVDLVNEMFPLKEELDEKFIKVAVDGFKGLFSIADLVPTIDKDGRINAKLYKEIQSHWEEVQRINNVEVLSTALEQVETVTNLETRNNIAKKQYFDLHKDIEVAVFGHTHIPAYNKYTYDDGHTATFVNCGTWVDNNFVDRDNTATFVLIESDDLKTNVKLLKCTGEGSVEKPVKVINEYTKY